MAAVGGHLCCLSIGNCIILPPATALQQHHYSLHSINNYPAAQTTFSWSLGCFHTGSMFPLPNYNNYDSFIDVIDSWARSWKVSPTSSHVAINMTGWKVRCQYAIPNVYFHVLECRHLIIFEKGSPYWLWKELLVICRGSTMGRGVAPNHRGRVSQGNHNHNP